MTKKVLHDILTIFIASIWLANGLIAKVMNVIPRHEDIVSKVLGLQDGRPLTVLIGLSEIIMFLWIMSKYEPRINATVQIAVILLMNIIELLTAPDLLLWGRINFIFALAFVGIIWYNEFILRKSIQ